MGPGLWTKLVDAKVILVSFDNLESGLVGNGGQQMALLYTKGAIARVHCLDDWNGCFINEGSAVAVPPVCLKLGLRCLRHFVTAFQSEVGLEAQQTISIEKQQVTKRYVDE